MLVAIPARLEMHVVLDVDGNADAFGNVGREVNSVELGDVAVPDHAVTDGSGHAEDDLARVRPQMEGVFKQRKQRFSVEVGEGHFHRFELRPREREGLRAEHALASGQVDISRHDGRIILGRPIREPAPAGVPGTPRLADDLARSGHLVEQRIAGGDAKAQLGGYVLLAEGHAAPKQAPDLGEVFSPDRARRSHRFPCRQLLQHLE